MGAIASHPPHDCFFNCLFRRRSKKTSKLRVTGLCVGNSPGPVNSPHKWPVTQKMFPFDDVIMHDLNSKYAFPAAYLNTSSTPSQPFATNPPVTGGGGGGFRNRLGRYRRNNANSSANTDVVIRSMALQSWSKLGSQMQRTFSGNAVYTHFHKRQPTASGNVRR